MADKKDIKLEEFLEKFDTGKNKDWLELQKDHNEAHKKAINKADLGVGKTRDQVINEFSNYITQYEEHIHGSSDGFKAYRKKLSKTQAEEFINRAARQGISFEQLHEEGLNKLVELYRESKRGQDFDAYKTSIAREFIDPQDHDKVNKIAEQLIKYDSATYSPADKTKIMQNIHGHIIGAGDKYKVKQLSKPLSEGYKKPDKK